MQIHTVDEQNNLMNWLMANQLTKSKKTIALLESWKESTSTIQRTKSNQRMYSRLFIGVHYDGSKQTFE